MWRVLPGSNPWFRVHTKSPSPGSVFARPGRKTASFWSQLFGDCPDVLCFKPTAPTDITYTYVVSVSCELMHFPPCAYSWFQGCRSRRIFVHQFSGCRCFDFQELVKVWTCGRTGTGVFLGFWWENSLKISKFYVYLPKGNSGRSMNPCLLASGVLKARGWTMRKGDNSAASRLFFIILMASRLVSGSKWQFTPTISAPVNRWPKC